MNKAMIDARKVKVSEEDFREANRGICKHLFSDRSEIDLEYFLEYKKKMKNALQHYSFH